MRAVSRLVSTLFSLKLFDDESRDTSKVGQAVSPAFPNELTMRELISSLMRFSGAVTMFAVEQVQNVVGAPTDTRAAIAKMTETLSPLLAFGAFEFWILNLFRISIFGFRIS